MKRVYTYRIDEEHLPEGAASCIVWALTKWAKASKGKLQFYRSQTRPDIIFSGAKPPDAFKIAWCQVIGVEVFSITFDPDVAWATTWWQRTFTQRTDFRKLALHEIGHVLLGMDHSPDPMSIMHYAPKWAEIDSASQKLVA